VVILNQTFAIQNHIRREYAARGKCGGTRDFFVVELLSGAQVLNAPASPACTRQQGKEL